MMGGAEHDGGGGGSEADKRTLWVGDIDRWMDENYIVALFGSAAEVANVKIIRDKMTGLPAGYGFVEFKSHEGAARVLNDFNNVPIPGVGRSFRLNWATFGIAARRPETGPEFSLFVGDLAPEISDDQLQAFFGARYRSVRSAKVVTDAATAASRGTCSSAINKHLFSHFALLCSADGYGFVRFGDETECYSAMTEMQGMMLGSRALRLSQATPKKSSSMGGGMGMPMGMPMGGGGGGGGHSAPMPEQADPSNTTIFVGNLDSTVGEDELRGHFMPFGELVYVRVPPGKNCGFVQFVHRSCAENAMLRVHGKTIGLVDAPAPREPDRPRAHHLVVALAYPDYYGAGAGMGMMPPAVAAPYAPVMPVAAPTPPVETSSTEDIYFTQSMDQVVKRQNEEFATGHINNLVPNFFWSRSHNLSSVSEFE
ncbi:RNA recognition motif domain containing protein [Acanthamoeba castellanii str. Neff]|uniref:RNA recognition motif domain containing protein n=1 Tax=Acanthamoeba castellanii (strain ATCC 30010 / Neff) TaxID=1257118 RepID=L8GTW3_ACACF|nr:RNA recognition motif domain containing protein [Acanthamoeba castellanii str. Neff]ELR16465.1 RNA recognition motif domain containing protein [Acanthamoeba castellanii str. Neff]